MNWSCVLVITTGATAASAVVHSSAGPALALAGRDGSALWAKVVSADDWQVGRGNTSISQTSGP